MNQSGFNSSNLGARGFLSKEQVQKELSDVDLIWICTTPELQLKCVKKILEIAKAKILIEKPVGLDLQINSEIKSLIEGNDNVFISRPWSFSKLWTDFLADIVNQGDLTSLEIKHFGEIARDFMAPPQDWLHHDLCLLEEIISLYKYKRIDFQIRWSSNRDTLKIVGEGDVSIEINGGFSKNRKSHISLTFHNETKLVLDLNEKIYSRIKIENELETFEFETNDSIPTMVDYFMNLKTNFGDREKEISILNRLQLLST